MAIAASSIAVRKDIATTRKAQTPIAPSGIHLKDRLSLTKPRDRAASKGLPSIPLWGGFVAAGAGAALGVGLGTIGGPVGMAIGGVLGGIVGFGGAFAYNIVAGLTNPDNWQF